MLGIPLRMTIFGLAVAIAATGPSLAQAPLRVGQGSPAAKPAAAQPAAPAAPAQPAAPPPPQPFKTEILNFDNWNVTCREFNEGKRKKICFAVLQIIQSNNNQVIFTWTVGTDDENRLLMTFQTPTGVAITPGVDLKLAKGNRVVPYTACESGHCVASTALDANLVKEIAATADAQAIIHASNGQDVQVNIPLKGFEKAYAALPK